jgi:hypothetical protein
MSNKIQIKVNTTLDPVPVVLITCGVGDVPGHVPEDRPSEIPEDGPKDGPTTKTFCPV